MNWNAISFDWNQARAFLATAEQGSLSAAAKTLGQTQPTLSRQVIALEKELGVLLFERVGRSMVLTAVGHELLECVREMSEAATKLSLKASGESMELEGRVTITATNTMATYHLPPVLAKIRKMAPKIELQLITCNEVRDLTRREADIAIRHGRPEQPELIAKLLGESHASLFASDSYIEKYGRPSTLTDLTTRQFIGFEASDTMLSFLNEVGLPLTGDNFKLSTGNGVTMIELIRYGLGIGILMHEDAAQFPELKPIFPDFQPIPVPVWLVTHKELHTSLRYRLVFDCIAESIMA